MTQILRFGEFNFGAQRLVHVLLQYKKQILANFILANADDSPNSPKFPPAKITRYTVMIFKACIPNGVKVVGSKLLCLKNYKINDHDCSVDVFNINMFADSKSIATIFPTSANEDVSMCDYTCTLSDDVVNHSDL